MCVCVCVCHRYRAGEARFTSDLVSTLNILHDYITREATAASLRIHVSFSPNTAALQHSLRAIWPQLHAQRTLKAQVELLEGILVSVCVCVCVTVYSGRTCACTGHTYVHKQATRTEDTQSAGGAA